MKKFMDKNEKKIMYNIHLEKCIGTEFILEIWGLGIPAIVLLRFLLDCSAKELSLCHKLKFY